MMRTATAVILFAALALLLVEARPRSQPAIARDGDGHVPQLRVERPAPAVIATGSAITTMSAGAVPLVRSTQTGNAMFVVGTTP